MFVYVEEDSGKVLIPNDKIAAYQTLYECLETITRLMAPIAPFFCDQVFRNLNGITKRHAVNSIHHADFPKVDLSKIDLALEQRMQMAQDICSLVLSIRKESKYQSASAFAKNIDSGFRSFYEISD